MTPAGQFRELLGGESKLVGTYTLSGAPAVIEAIALAGFSYIIVDCEHSSTSPYGPELEGLLRAATTGGSLGLVRVLSNEPAQIGRVLDAGAAAVVVPGVKSRGEMERAVSSARRPPRGIRGSAPMVRGAGYGTRPWTQAVNDPDVIVAPLIEHPDGVQNAPQILDVPGVEAVWFGAFDLAVAMGLPYPGEPHPAIDEARQAVYDSARLRGVPVLDHAWDAIEAARLLQQGATGVSVTTDLSFLASGMGSLAADIRRHAASAGSGKVTAQNG